MTLTSTSLMSKVLPVPLTVTWHLPLTQLCELTSHPLSVSAPPSANTEMRTGTARFTYNPT